MPAKPILHNFNVGGIECFVIQKDDNDLSTRQLVFEDDGSEVMLEFKNAVRKIIDLKMYIESAIYEKEKVES